MKRFVESYTDYIKREMDYETGDSMDIDNMLDNIQEEENKLEYAKDEIEYYFDLFNDKYPDLISNMLNSNMFGEYDYLDSIVDKIKRFYLRNINEYGYLEDFSFNDKAHIQVLKNMITDFINKNIKK